MTGYAWPMTRDAHALDRLREMYPGWRIWHVPSPSGPGTWCAQPLPLINVGSPDELMRAIEGAEPAQAYRVCAYSPKHKMAGVRAETTIDSPGLGTIPACRPCAELYDRLGGSVSKSKPL